MASLEKQSMASLMDYRELNTFVKCHTSDEMVAVCGEKIRKWRQLCEELRVVDLSRHTYRFRFQRTCGSFKS